MKQMKRPKAGSITPNGVFLAEHEYMTLLTLTNLGYDVDLIPPSYTPGSKTGDIWMLGKIWEIKAPVGKSRSTMEHVVQKAARQAHNIIIDLRRTKIKDDSSIKELNKLFQKFRSIRNLWIITKDEELIKLQK